MIFDDAIVSKHALIQKRSTKFSIVAVIMIGYNRTCIKEKD
jgi:hypothetical protein